MILFLKPCLAQLYKELVLGKIIIDEQEFQIPVFAGDEIREILLGSQWLKIFKLTADYSENVVTLL